MKRLLPLLLLLLSLRAEAAVTNVSALVTFTNMVNGTTNGDTITVNGDVRRYTNGVLAAPSTWILSTNTVGWSSTNTWLHLGTYAPLGTTAVYPTNTSNIVIVGSFQTNTLLSVSLSAGVGTVSYSTQVWAELRPIVAPNGSVATEAGRTNNVNGLLSLLADNRVSNAVPASAPMFTNHLNQFAQQQASNKLFYATTNRNGAVESAGRISGSNVGLTNGYTVNLTNINSKSSNHVNYGNALRSEGPGGVSLQIGTNSTATGLRTIAVGANATNSGQDAIVVGVDVDNSQTNSVTLGIRSTNRITRADPGSIGNINIGNDSTTDGVGNVNVGFANALTNNEQVAVGYGVVNTGYRGITLGSESGAYEAYGIGLGGVATKINAMALGPGTATHSNSAAIGPKDDQGTVVVTTDTNQLSLGTSRHRVYSVGLYESPKSTNSQFAGTNIARGSWSYPAFALTTLAAGNNISVPFGTNVYIRAGAGPASAATICGIIGGATTGGLDGQVVRVFNDTGFTLTFAVNTVDPVAANRINTPLGTDVSIADQSWAFLTYDGTDSRWKLVSTFPIQASATNAVGSVFTNGVVVSGAATNVNFISTDDSVRSTNTSGNVDVSIRSQLNGEVSVTNATRIGLVYDRSGATNRLRSLSAGAGVTLTNEGTNVVIAGMGYTITGGNAATSSPGDATSYYWGSDLGLGLNTTWDQATIDIPKAGTLKRVFVKIRVAGTLGSGEAVSHYIRVNDSTDVSVNTTATWDTAVTNIAANVSQALAVGDRVALKVTTPTWVTNPTSVRTYILLYIE